MKPTRFTVIILEGDFTKISIENIAKNYGKKQVLKGISFEANSGECVAILGSNGCGKSTLFNILNGIISKNSGRFLCDGKDLLSDPKTREKIVAYVPQSPLLIEELSAKDNLLMWYSGDEIKASLSGGVMNILGINDFLKTPVKKMSGGMKKRLSIACAVSNKPKILILDEPSSALDPACKKTIHEYIKRFKKFGGIVIISTHDLDELAFCDASYIIKDGLISAFKMNGDIDGTVTEL